MALSDFSANKTIVGTEGKLFVDGELVCGIKSCEAKLTMSFEELNINGKYITAHRYTGGSIAGSFSIYKSDSYLLSTIGTSPKSGTVPNVTIQINIPEPQTGTTQVVALYNCQFEEMSLGQFENAAILEEDIPFNCSDYEILDTI